MKLCLHARVSVIYQQQGSRGVYMYKTFFIRTNTNETR